MAPTGKTNKRTAAGTEGGTKGAASDFDLGSFSRPSTPSGGGGATNQRLPPLSMPASVASSGSRFTPAVVTQPQSALGNLVGARTPRAYGATGRFDFKEGGKVKKMAKGGSVSSASKRADGCATKGKTKGRFV